MVCYNSLKLLLISDGVVSQQSFMLVAESFIRRGSRNPFTCDIKLYATAVRYGFECWMW